MKKFLLILVIVGTAVISCSKVPAGNVGIKVYLLGGAKGVDTEELSVGRYWIGINEELYLFPTFKQNYVWTKDKNEGSPNDESITFQTKEGLDVSADIGITYAIDGTKANLIFQKYRRGVEEITDVFLRNKVRDSFNLVASKYEVESVYGKGKASLLEDVNKAVAEDLKNEGILIERIYLIGKLRLPPQVERSIGSKIEATQKALQAQNEVARAKAEAEKMIAEAKGEAEALRQKSLAITDKLLRYEAIKKWNGILPTYMSNQGAIPFIKIDN